MVFLFDGAPLPPCPDCAPPGPTYQFFAVLLGIVLIVLTIEWAVQQLRRKPTYEEFPGGDSCGDDALRWPTDEDELEKLIDASPGGRKPWQDRRSHG